MAFEFGYGYQSQTFSANVNVYSTQWKDKYFRESVRLPNGDFYQANIEGVNALHQGVEVDMKWKPFKSLLVTGMASIGDWRWQNDLEDVIIVDENQNEIERVNLYIADLKVGDAAQTTFAIGANYEIFEGFKM